MYFKQHILNRFRPETSSRKIEQVQNRLGKRPSCAQELQNLPSSTFKGCSVKFVTWSMFTVHRKREQT